MIRAQFELPEHREVLCGISFGYSDDTHPADAFRTARETVDDVAVWAA